MARIKIDDLPVLEDLSQKQMQGIFGGQRIVRLARRKPIEIDFDLPEGDRDADFDRFFEDDELGELGLDESDDEIDELGFGDLGMVPDI